MSGESNLIMEISKSNLNIQRQLREIKEETFLDNIAMIVDYFLQNLEQMDIFLNEKKVFRKIEAVPDIRISGHRKIEKPDPESIQSVLQFISSTLMREHEIVIGTIRKSGLEQEYLENYAENIEILRKKAENLYHDLVER
ncbi:MAG: hypothetical protein ACYCSO_04130 [Cuniculiplasma sp.]